MYMKSDIILFLKKGINCFKNPFELAKKISKLVPEKIKERHLIYITASKLSEVIEKNPLKYYQTSIIEYIANGFKESYIKNQSESLDLDTVAEVYKHIFSRHVFVYSMCINLLQSKKIYGITPELSDMLWRTKLPKDLKIQDLKKLPAHTFCIHAPRVFLEELKVEYFLVSIHYANFEENQDLDDYEIYMYTRASDSKLSNEVICFDDETLEVLLNSAEEFEDFYNSMDLEDEVESGLKNSTILLYFLKILVYLTSDSIDVEEIEYVEKLLPPKAKKKNKKAKKFEVSEDSFKELRISRVGNTITKAVKEYERDLLESNDKEHSCKRPHIRAGHYHTYWKGSKDDKKAVRKWISSIFVNKHFK